MIKSDMQEEKSAFSPRVARESDLPAGLNPQLHSRFYSNGEEEEEELGHRNLLK